MSSHRYSRGGPASALALLASLALMIALLPLAPVSAVPGGSDARGADVHPDLAAEAAEGPTEAVMVLAGRPNLGRVAGDREAVVERLKAVAAERQMRLFERMRAAPEFAGIEILNTFWLQNMVLIEVDGPDELEAAASLPGVDRLIPNFSVRAPEPEPASDVGPAIVGDLTWGLDRIGADRVWNDLGLDGSGVRVATLDTGVAIDHPDLEGKLVTDDASDPHYPGGWMEFDGSGQLVESEPRDSSYHGTHVSGTIHGGDDSGVAIGAAPGADMMHGLVIPGGSGSFAQVAAGMQWTIDPTDADGNPAGEPADVVNMSLGADGFYEAMIEPTRNMYLAGTFPAFAIGNGGSGITGSPGNVFEAVGVGATNDNDDVASFSGGGVVDRDSWTNPPGDWPDSYVKPEISAPGEDVWSADPGGGYRYLSGTSMATPHVAGTAALMLQAAPGSAIDLLLDTLADTAFWDDRYGDSPPDTRFGHGRIDAYEATSLLAIDSGIEGTVTDADSGDPIDGAAVTVTGEELTVTTGDDGAYLLRLEPGTYELEASAFGYDAGSATVTVSEEQFVDQDFDLDPGPRGAVEGTVTLETSGEGIPGVGVELLDVPVDLSDETDGDGGYGIADVPVGEYEVSASHPLFGDVSTQTVEVTDGATVTADFAFPEPVSDTVGVLGDYSGTITAFLSDNLVDAEEIGWDDPVTDYGAIVVNRPGDPGEADFARFLSDTDAAGVGVVFTDTWSTSGNGIYLLHTHVGNPSERETGSGSSIPSLHYEVTEPHDILAGFEVGDEITFDEVTTFKDHAWFGGYAGDGRETIADAARSDQDATLGGGIGVQERGNNRHALLSMHASSIWTQPEDWHADSQQVFLNAVDWVMPDPDEGQPVFVPHDLSVVPDVVVADEEVDVSVEVTNVGAGAGDYEAVLAVAGETEATETVSLGAGETAQLSWTVTRQELGTYEVSLGHLSDAFRVRPPIVEVEAWTVPEGDAGAEPLADASVAFIEDGSLRSVGQTDDEGTLAFELDDATADLTLVVHTADQLGDPSQQYLLHRDVTVTEDVSVTFAPSADADEAENLVATVDLALEPVDPDHRAAVYVRGEGTAPHGFAFDPGAVHVTPDTYETVAAHHLPGISRDWWYASEISGGNDWTVADSFQQALGGELALGLTADSPNGDREVQVDWDLTEGAGASLDMILATELGPFVERLPATLELEGLTDVLAGLGGVPADITLTLSDRDDGLHTGTIDWDERSLTFNLDDYDPDPHPRANYHFDLEVETGPYAGILEATDNYRPDNGGGGGGNGGQGGQGGQGKGN